MTSPNPDGALRRIEEILVFCLSVGFVVAVWLGCTLLIMLLAAKIMERL